MLQELFNNYTYRTVLFGTTVIGAVSATVGCFIYLKRQGLFADVISHSALPGIMLSFIIGSVFLGNGRMLWFFTAAAVCCGIFGAFTSSAITKHSPVGTETAMAVSIVTFFGAGMLLLAHVQSQPYPGKGGIQDYLFGNAAQLTHADLILSGSASIICLTLIAINYRCLKTLCFDREYALVKDVKVKRHELTLFAMLALVTVSGMRAVGVILIIAFVLLPPAAARQWSRSLKGTVMLAAIIGASAASGGSLLTIHLWDAPTGPVIVLILFAIFVLSLLIAPQRGILALAVKRHLKNMAEL